MWIFLWNQIDFLSIKQERAGNDRQGELSLILLCLSILRTLPATMGFFLPEQREQWREVRNMSRRLLLCGFVRLVFVIALFEWILQPRLASSFLSQRRP